MLVYMLSISVSNCMEVVAWNYFYERKKENYLMVTLSVIFVSVKYITYEANLLLSLKYMFKNQ